MTFARYVLAGFTAFLFLAPLPAQDKKPADEKKPALLKVLLPRDDVALTWLCNSYNETGFAVERSNDGVHFTRIATLPANLQVGVGRGVGR